MIEPQLRLLTQIICQVESPQEEPGRPVKGHLELQCSLSILATLLAAHYWGAGDISIKELPRWLSNEIAPSEFWSYPLRAWIKSTEAEDNKTRLHFLGAVESLWETVRDFQLTREELSALLGQLYPLYFSLADRKGAGEEYTPDEIVSFILDAVGYDIGKPDLDNQRLIDPACGSGAFLAQAVRRYLANASFKAEEYGWTAVLRNLIDNRRIVGLDVSPLACYVAKLRYLLEFQHLGADESTMREFATRIPVVTANALDPALTTCTELADLVDSFDYVIGNPPYVRIQSLPPQDRERLRATYEAALGRFDLSVIFIERGLQMLKPGGLLGFISTNKFMVSNYGKGIRSVITKKANFRLLVDLADTRYFQSAVLPAIFVLQKSPPSAESFPYVLARIASNASGGEGRQLLSLLPEIERMLKQQVTSALVKVKKNNGALLPIEVRTYPVNQPDRGSFWHFMTSSEKAIIEKLDRVATTTLGGLAKSIFVGIKTTADNVFVTPMTAKYIQEQNIETALLYPLLQHRNVRRWNITWSAEDPNDRFILYPHRVSGGRLQAVDLADFPNAASYLYQHKAALEDRSYLREAGRKWYEIWVPQHPRKFQVPYKIVTPDLATRNAFALDKHGYFCQGHLFVIVLRTCKSADLNKFVLGLLNSDLLEFYHKRASSTFIYARRYRYWTSYLKQWPIVEYAPLQPSLQEDTASPDRRHGLGEDIIACVDEILRLAGSDQAEDALRKKELELNRLVYDLYEIRSKDQELIQEFLESTR